MKSRDVTLIPGGVRAYVGRVFYMNPRAEKLLK